MLTFMCSCTDKTNTETEPLPQDTDMTGETAGLPAFSSYTAELTDGSENYLLTLTAENGTVCACLENNRYEAFKCTVEAPENFSAVIPQSDENGREICRIITNDVDKSLTVPDIVRFTFTDGQKNVYKFYTIKDGKFCEAALRDTDRPGIRPVSTEYLSASALYHSEADKFIAGIIVDESAGIVDDISRMVKIHTLKFNPEKPELVGGFEELSEDNPIYFGYAYWGLANSAAVHFTEKPFNISDYDNFVEISDSEEPGGILYYYHVDDPRFFNTSDVMEYLKKIFSENTAERLFNRAPQKYRDINGELCTLTGESLHDNSIGMLTFTSYSRTSDRKSIMYTTRQEKYDENGVFSGYIDGGDFRIDKVTEWLYDEEAEKYTERNRWIVSSYRYPYS